MEFPLPHQLIIFGPPGTSKSYLARTEKAEQLGARETNIVPVTFHPDYSYGEFVARLLPMSRKGAIHYDMYAGPFIRALALAYGYLADKSADEKAQNVVLLIDEINRGNCAEIFGDVFQLLDRADDGWSSYEISVSALTIEALRAELSTFVKVQFEQLPGDIKTMLEDRRLKLPPNLFLISTMNTSDESVFFMDSAFKRRWNFEFRTVGFEGVPEVQKTASVTQMPYRSWSTLLDALNAFILAECPSRNMDDKLIGPWFIKAKACSGQTLVTKFNQEIAYLDTLSKKVTKINQGADNSQIFEDALLKFAHSLDTPIRAGILKYAHYDSAAPRKLKVIAYDESSLYYLSRSKYPNHKGKTIVIEDFIVGLGQLPAEPFTHKIDRADIVGKLFLYLWDSVFERDKSPLAKKLGVPREELRTFGQFADKAEVFLDRLCPVSETVSVTTPTAQPA